MKRDISSCGRDTVVVQQWCLWLVRGITMDHSIKQQCGVACSHWAELGRLRSMIVGDLELQDEFEACPHAVLGSLGDIFLTGTFFGDRRIVEVLDEAPAGVRLVVLDCILSSTKAADSSNHDPEIEPYAIWVVANLAAVFNAIAMQNAALYHQAGLVLWVGAAAAVNRIAKYKGVGSFPCLGEDVGSNHVSLVFGQGYLNGSWHKFLKNRGYGTSREKMAVRRILGQVAEPVLEEGMWRFKSFYRNRLVSFLVEFSDVNSELLIREAEIF